MAGYIVGMSFVGSFSGSDFENYFRFTRAWCKTVN